MGEVVKLPTQDKSRYPAEFEAFWSSYPKRQGCNPKFPAFGIWKKALSIETAENLVLAAENYGKAMADKVGTPYICQAKTWLFQRRYEEYIDWPPESQKIETDQYWRDRVKFYKKTGIWGAYSGPKPDENGCDVPREILAEFGY